MRRSKIVRTSGPATSSEKIIRGLIKAGANTLWINRSRGIQEEDEAVIAMVRRVSANFDQPVAILVDLQGPKVRLSISANGSEELVKGQDLTITTRDIEGGSKMVSIAYKGCLLRMPPSPRDRIIRSC